MCLIITISFHVIYLNIMDKYMLRSTRINRKTPYNYAGAILHDNELHITPLHGLVNLQQDRNYYDKADKQNKQKGKKDGDEWAEEEEEAKQVTVKFARQENDRIKRARERSFRFVSKRSTEEAWHSTEFHHANSYHAELERGKLYCTKPHEKICKPTLALDECMKNVALSDENSKQNEGLTQHCDSINSVKQLPIVDQIKILLKNAKVLPFGLLLSLLVKGADPVDVLRTVQQVAMLVQGNWVVRSEVLYVKDTISNTITIPRELMCRGRDYILYLFTRHEYVDRSKLVSVIKLPPDEIEEMLGHVASSERTKGWKLLYPCDNDFIKKYPDIVERQHMVWDAKHKQLMESLREGILSPGKPKRKTNRDSSVSDNEPCMDRPKPVPVSPNRRQRRKSQRESFSSDNESGAEEGVRLQRNNCKVPRRTVKQVAAIKVDPLT